MMAVPVFSMRVLFINKSDSGGGAAIAAYRLYRALNNLEEIDTLFLAAKKQLDDPRVIAVRSSWQWAFEMAFDVVARSAGFQYQWIPFSGRTLLAKTMEFSPDVISLHNIHSGYFPIRLLAEISSIAPVVWTLHDMWSFTGGPAHTHGDDSWMELKAGLRDHRYYPKTGINLGSFHLRQKERVYARSNITVVTPSKWLQKRAVMSPVFRCKEVHCIPNCIDTDVFRPSNRKTMRAKLGLPSEGNIVAFAAEFLSHNEWKGGKELVDIVSELDRRISSTLTLVALGHGRPKFPPLKKVRIVYPGFVSGESRMAEYLSTADVLIYPSKADVFGLLLAEAFSCGTPVVTYDVGSCGELVENGLRGYSVAPFDCVEFVSKVLCLLSDKVLHERFSNAAREYAVRNFSFQNVALAYHHLFQVVVSKSGQI